MSAWNTSWKPNQRGERSGRWTAPPLHRRPPSTTKTSTAVLARQILSAVDEMTPPQRVAAAEVIGQALVDSGLLTDLKTQVIEELWLPDLERTAWHVLHADRRSDDPAGRKAFLEAWSNA
ncbi:hypothetical protein SGL43_03322 [Streptomyces globisporus]|uniref:Uncharacterized protein n=1 Tax=Streptomyces globisporus TaxID=1908 RepID=A0ABN8V176_STRGL|nr:hypothetical protein SGL43_03322 [Streptomyces globisporus]